MSLKVERGRTLARSQAMQLLFQAEARRLTVDEVLAGEYLITKGPLDPYAEELAQVEQFDVAMLEPGLVARVLGRRVLALGGFEAALGDARAKQRMWAYLKQLPPIGSPL